MRFITTGNNFSRTIYSFLLLCYSFTSAYSQTAEDPSGSFEIKLLNDSWGGGFGENHDDHRSYGVFAAFKKADRFNINCTYSGLTNRSKPNPENGGRVDELWLSGDFILKRNLFNSFSLHAVLGLFVHSNLGGTQIQNTLHPIFGVVAVDLPYADRSRLHAQAGICIISRPFYLKKSDNSIIYISPEIETFIVPNYYFSFRPEIPVVLKSTRGDYLSAILAYQFSHSYTSSKVLNPVLQSESGFAAEYRIYCGFFSMGLISYLKTGFSYGNYGFQFFFDKKSDPFNVPDFTIEAGGLADGNGNYHKYLWNKTQILPARLLFTFTHQYGSYLRKRLGEYPNLSGLHQQLSLGAEIRMFRLKEKFQINPYMGLNTGIRREVVFSGSTEIVTDEALSPSITGEAGIIIKPPSNLYFRNTIWGLSLHYKYSKYLFTKKHLDFKEKYNLTSPYENPGIGLFIIIDY